MDRESIRELFDYTGWAWERIERTIDGLPPGTFERAVDGSGWPALRDCFQHFCAAYDGWVHGKWALALGDMIFTGPDSLATWEQAKAYRPRVRAAFLAALAAPDDVLFAKKAYEFDGVPESLSRADILSNLVLHERGHHGDINTLFHQLGVRSFFVDYRYFITRPADFILDEDDPEED
ncbi:MAG: DinB family protein [Tepidiformaceae bacterium]